MLISLQTTTNSRPNVKSSQAVAPCEGHPCYPQALKQAMSRHLPCGLFGTAVSGRGERHWEHLGFVPNAADRSKVLTDGRNRQMHLLNNVLDESPRTDVAALGLYTTRWGRVDDFKFP